MRRMQHHLMSMAGVGPSSGPCPPAGLYSPAGSCLWLNKNLMITLQYNIRQIYFILWVNWLIKLHYQASEFHRDSLGWSKGLNSEFYFYIFKLFYTSRNVPKDRNKLAGCSDNRSWWVFTVSLPMKDAVWTFTNNIPDHYPGVASHAYGRSPIARVIS